MILNLNEYFGNFQDSARTGSGSLAVEDVLQQVKAAGNGEEDDLLHDPGAALIARMLAFGFDFLDCHHGTEVLQEIHAAFLADAALALLVMARRALESQSGVAARTKARHDACLGRAFGAFHTSIL
jgi:hypothetical protein